MIKKKKPTDELFNEIASKPTNELFNEIIEAKKKSKGEKKSLFIPILVTVGAVIVVGLGIGVYFLSNFIPENELLEREVVILEEEILELGQIHQERELPVEVPEWTLTPHFMGFWESGANREAARQWARLMGIDEQIRHMPSEAEGYSSDPEDLYIQPGLINPRYSFMLRDDVEYAFAVMVHRLINPIFGDWWDLQRIAEHENIEMRFGDFSRFRRMFTAQWWEENITGLEHKVGGEHFSHFPIFADWNMDRFGGRDIIPFEGTGLFFGEVLSVEFEFITNSQVVGDFDETFQALQHGESRFTIIATLDVGFSAWAEDGSRYTERGTLRLELVENHDDFYNREYRFIINQAELGMR